MDSSSLGRVLVAVGLLVGAAGAWLALGHRLPFGSLPGDISVRSGNVGFAFPIVTCILLSVLLTIILNVIIRR